MIESWKTQKYVFVIQCKHNARTLREIELHFKLCTAVCTLHFYKDVSDFDAVTALLLHPNPPEGSGTDKMCGADFPAVFLYL